MEQAPVQPHALARRRRVEDRVYVALGSNLGDREAHLAAALDALHASEGVSVLAVSAVYETEPVGPPPQGRYLNAVTRLRTALAPRPLLRRLLLWGRRVVVVAGPAARRLGRASERH